MYGLPQGVSLAINLLAGKIEQLKSKSLIIAIDGHSSSGKSTLAKDLSSILQFLHIDSGAMYRAVTLYFLRNQVNVTKQEAIDCALCEIVIDFEQIEGHSRTILNGEDVEKQIRSMEVSQTVSDVAAISSVRKFLVMQQRSLSGDHSVIMDGRDIGTVVFPDADVKLFVTASHEVRTQRRFDELVSKGVDISISEVAQNLKNRDHIDSTREDSPLKRANDAIELDTSHLNRGQMVSKALQIIFERSEQTKEQIDNTI